MKKRIFCLLCACLVLTGLLAGCGGGGPAEASATTGAMIVSDSASAGFTSESGETDAAVAEPEPADPTAIRAGAKLVLRAEIQAEAKDFAAADAAVQNLTAKLGGYLENLSADGTEGYRSTSYTIRVPQDKFEAFLEQLGSSCHILSQDRSAEDISEAYFDTETHLAVLKTKQERLLALLQKADKMEDIIKLEDSLSDVQYKIEQLTGALRHYDSLVGFSTINLQLSEVRDLSAVQESNSFASQVRTAAAIGSRTFVLFVQGIILFCLYLWPLLVLCLIALFVILWVRRRRRAAKQQKTSTSINPPKDDNNPDSPR